MEQSAIKALIAKRHPSYATQAPEWDFLQSAITGGPEYTRGNLYPHALEPAQIYAGRMQRAKDHHLNISKMVVDSYEGYLHQTPPTIAETVPDAIRAYTEKATQAGASIEAFGKSVSRDVESFGIIYIATDKPTKPDDRILSALEEKELDLKPYSYIIHPQDMLDGKIINGQFVWCMVRETVREDETPQSSGEIITRFRVWENHQITVFTPVKDANGTVTYTEDIFPNALGCVPIVRVKFAESTDDFACPGLIADIAHIDRTIFNYNSLQSEIHFKTTFPQLKIPYDGMIFETNEDGIESLTEAGQAIMKMGVNSFIPFSSTLGSGPDYMNYPDGPSKDLREAVRELIQAAVTMAFLDGENAVEGKQSVGSGVSKAYTFQKLNKRLSAIADMLEAAFMQVFKYVCLWSGTDIKAIPEGAIDYPDTFEVKSLTQEIVDVVSLLGSGIKSETLEAKIYKQLVVLAFPKMDEDEQNTIFDEIDGAVKDAYEMADLSSQAAAATMTDGLDPASIVKADATSDVRQAEKDNKESGARNAEL